MHRTTKIQNKKPTKANRRGLTFWFHQVGDFGFLFSVVAPIDPQNSFVRIFAGGFSIASVRAGLAPDPSLPGCFLAPAAKPPGGQVEPLPSPPTRFSLQHGTHQGGSRLSSTPKRQAHVEGKFGFPPVHLLEPPNVAIVQWKTHLHRATFWGNPVTLPTPLFHVGPLMFTN